jgi:hypothetical protein
MSFLELYEQEERTNKISSELDTLIELQNDINTLVYEQDQTVDNITQHITNTNANIEIAKADIKESHKIYWKFAGPVSAGIAGAVVAGPVGFYVGMKGALLAGIMAGSGVVSGLGTKAYNMKLRKK